MQNISTSWHRWTYSNMLLWVIGHLKKSLAVFFLKKHLLAQWDAFSWGDSIGEGGRGKADWGMERENGHYSL